MNVTLALIFLASFILPFSSVGLAGALAASSPQTYTVMIGAENSNQGVTVEGYFPSTVYIHPGDTVHWVQNAFEVHTVTFLDNTPLPTLILPVPDPNVFPSPLMLNPVAAFPTVPANNVYDGTGFVNSGITGRDPGMAQEFNLTFTTVGEFDYLCLVHGPTMSGKVIVVPMDQAIPSPNQSAAQGNLEIAQGMAKAPDAFRQAQAEAAQHPPEKNADGTTTYHVMMGFMAGNIDLMRFFPDNLVVGQGDTVNWYFPAGGEAPHTITFLNGASPAGLAIPFDYMGQTYLVINPEVFFPQNEGQPVTRQGIYSSGLMLPNPAGFSTVIGSVVGRIDYLCLVHDDSGMKATLTVKPAAASNAFNDPMIFLPVIVR